MYPFFNCISIIEDKASQAQIVSAGVRSFREPMGFHDPIPLSEKLVQAIWLDQLFDTSNLTTSDGKSLKILNPGRWNAQGGPDFSAAELTLDHEIFFGDIEIHLHSTGWNEHQHGTDPTYNHVILDVCLWETDTSIPIHTHQGRIVPQLVLHSYLQSSINELAESLDPELYPYSQAQFVEHTAPLAFIPQPEVYSYIEWAGILRFKQKVARIIEKIASKGKQQAAYEFLAQALGYRYNKFIFENIAQAVPLSNLIQIPSADEKIALLLKEVGRHSLHFHRCRPNNHPHRRLAALALITQQYPNLSQWFHNLLKDSKNRFKPPLLNHPYWSWHFKLNGEVLQKPASLLGESRWKEILTNVILPYLAAEAEINSDPLIGQQVMKIYMTLPASQNNLFARQIAYELGIPIPSRIYQQQGLIQIYQESTEGRFSFWAQQNAIKDS